MPELSRLATVQTMHRDHVATLLKMGELPSEHDEQTALIEYCADPDTHGAFCCHEREGPCAGFAIIASDACR